MEHGNLGGLFETIENSNIYLPGYTTTLASWASATNLCRSTSYGDVLTYTFEGFGGIRLEADLRNNLNGNNRYTVTMRYRLMRNGELISTQEVSHSSGRQSLDLLNIKKGDVIYLDFKSYGKVDYSYAENVSITCHIYTP